MFRRGTKSVESNSRLSASPLIAAQTKAKPAATDRIKGRGCERLLAGRFSSKIMAIQIFWIFA
jgi:hypothetical protein